MAATEFKTGDKAWIVIDREFYAWHEEHLAGVQVGPVMEVTLGPGNEDYDCSFRIAGCSTIWFASMDSIYPTREEACAEAGISATDHKPPPPAVPARRRA